jgi:hypothetical protein
LIIMTHVKQTSSSKATHSAFAEMVLLTQPLFPMRASPLVMRATFWSSTC